MSSKKHIVIDARELRTSSGRYVERLLNYLQQVDHNHRYSVLLNPKDMDGWTPQNENFTKVACPHKEFTFDEQFGLKKQVKQLKPDLVHFAFAQQPVLYRGRVVTTMHDLTTLRFRNPDKNALVFWAKQRVYAWVNKRVARKSFRVITPTEFVKHDVATFTGVPADKVVVTYESADAISDAPEPLKGLEGKPFIMYVGRPTPHKNLWRLVEAFKYLQKQYPDLQLVLAGKTDNNYQQIADRVKAEQIANITFTGFISEGQLRWLYENTAAYVFPSLSEGFGLPALEAMIHHAPVVSSNATCLPEVLGEAALYFDPLDVADMAKKVNDVISDKALAKQLVAKGSAQVAKYSWQRMAEQTLDIYKQALGE